MRNFEKRIFKYLPIYYGGVYHTQNRIFIVTEITINSTKLIILTGKSINISDYSDRKIVLNFWGNTAYQFDNPNDQNFEQIESNLRKRWRLISELNNDDINGWRWLREEFEKHGWK